MRTIFRNLSLALGVAAMVCSCHSSNKTAASTQSSPDQSRFYTVIDTLSEGTNYAIVEVGEPLLLVADGVYDVDASTEGAIGAKAYGIAPGGTIKDLGELRTQGTAYPFSILDGKLLVEGHHFSRMYSVKDGELVLEDEYDEIYSNKGETVTYYHMDKNGAQTQIDEAAYMAHIKNTESLEVINFKK